MEYSKTINLPDSSFPMKAGLAQKEPKMLEKWENENLYQRLRESRKGKEKYILHDGPPYANGDIHMGTALNKILKDIIVRFKAIQGYDTPYVPGWDCHGLPIEHRVVQKLTNKKKLKETSLDELRSMCREYAAEYVDKQREQFKRLGGIGDWDNPYLTMSREYEAAIVDTFAKLVEEGYVYKGLRPIHWSWAAETALAEAEVEYEQHTSTSVYVKFPVENGVNEKISGSVYAMIWTTTPWTLPANVACAFNAAHDYVAVKIEGDWCIMAKGLMEATLQKQGYEFEKLEIQPISIEEIEKLKIKHPFIDRESKVVFADYVTLETGTGIVHTAPGHGQEDYQTGLKYDLPILSPVDRRGRYTDEFAMMEGEHVFKANPKIVELLEGKGLLYYSEDITHSYPHCWRTKKPLIFRATEQWFLKIDHNGLRGKTISQLPEIKWFPKWGEKRMSDMLSGRPDWCLSRQRAWGVPIPAFYCEDCGETILTTKTAKHFSDIVKEKGVDVWFTEEVEKLIPEGLTCKCGSKNFAKESDILDVWFDSGVSSFAVLDEREELSAPADLYIEGNDQYRGWFQASIWPSVALRGFAPYKTIVTSGWMLDENGKTMHKSAGNAVSPEKVTKQYGADILRLWVISEDFKEDLRLGDKLLKITADSYRKIRNSFRYLLGNLADFNPEEDLLPHEELKELDRYALSRLQLFLKYAEEKMQNFDFHMFYQRLVNYCNTELSSTYFDILKDRLYCDGKKSKSRRSGQSALYHILQALVRTIAPVMPFTAEEVWQHYNGGDAEPVQLQYWISADEKLIDKSFSGKWERVMALREEALKALELEREKGSIKKSLEGKIIINPLSAEDRELIQSMKEELKEVFIVSEIELSEEKDDSFFEGRLSFVKAAAADGDKCLRCWKVSDDIGNDSEHTELCGRCAEAVK